MIGNVWEWTAEWYAGAGRAIVVSDGGVSPVTEADTIQHWPVDLGSDIVSRVSNNLVSTGQTTGTFGLPVAAIRGGSYREGTGAGVFTVALDASPLVVLEWIGFRCVIPR